MKNKLPLISVRERALYQCITKSKKWGWKWVENDGRKMLALFEDIKNIALKK